MHLDLLLTPRNSAQVLGVILVGSSTSSLCGGGIGQKHMCCFTFSGDNGGTMVVGQFLECIGFSLEARVLS